MTILFDKVSNIFSHLSHPRSRHILITDKTIEGIYASTLKNFEFETIVISPGESSKTRETKHAIEDQMLAKGFGRDSCIIALGGGVVTDLAGFVAATYCRGIPWISVPTTLVGMVDASIGGKTGVDVPQGKNLIGAFHPPSLTLIDPWFLDTLPEVEWKNGCGEVIKHSLIASKPLFHLLEKGGREHLLEILHQSIAIKNSVVEADPLEKGMRRILNFGHTIAHALETLLQYRIAHGEAVGIGLLIESYLSHRLGYLQEEEFKKIAEMLSSYGFSAGFPEEISWDALLDAMSMDKKALRSEPRFVLIESIGRAMSFEGEFCCPVDQNILREAYGQFSYSTR